MQIRFYEKSNDLKFIRGENNGNKTRRNESSSGSWGFNNNPGWIQTQEDDLNLLVETMWEARFEYNSISAILREHVWEHLTFEEGVKAASICYKF